MISEYKAEIDRQAEENINNISEWLNAGFESIIEFTEEPIDFDSQSSSDLSSSSFHDMSWDS